MVNEEADRDGDFVINDRTQIIVYSLLAMDLTRS